MPGRWVPAPRQFPGVCGFTGVSDASHGPYVEFEMTRPWIDPVSGAKGRMYWAWSDMRTLIDDSNSPLAQLIDQKVRERTQELQSEVDQLHKRIEADPLQRMVDELERFSDPHGVHSAAPSSSPVERKRSRAPRSR